jgi:hypothetical protein
MTWSFPPQRAQSSISMPNTRFSRRAQLIAPGRGVGGLATSAAGSDCGAPIPRCAGVTPPGARSGVCTPRSWAGSTCRSVRQTCLGESVVNRVAPKPDEHHSRL